MINILVLILVVASLVLVAVIVIRKFPLLANLDIDSLPAEKILKTKKQIITKRIENKGAVLKEKIILRLRPLKKYWEDIQLRFRIYVGKVQRLWQHEQVARKKGRVKDDPEVRAEELERLIHEAEGYLAAGDYEQAENTFISAISIDPKNAIAYRGLADAYLAKNELEEARQTYRFLTRLEPDDDCVFVKLAEIAESQGDLEEAIEYYQKAVLINDSLSPRFYHLTELLLKVGQPEVAKEAALQAVELEPQNPKYLDLLIETAIICGDKATALQGLEELRLVNPDNQKLDSFRERIFKIK